MSSNITTQPMNEYLASLSVKNTITGSALVMFTEPGGATEAVNKSTISPLDEAPLDSSIYGRKDSSWVAVSDVIEEAPEDGNTYGRKDASWINVGSAITLNNSHREGDGSDHLDVANNSVDINTNTNDIISLNTEQPNGFTNKIDDGDFNHAHEGKTTTTTTGEYLTDTWYAKGNIGDWSIASHSTTNSKRNYLEHIGSASHTNAQIRNNFKGNKWSGKTIICALRLRASSSAPTALKARVVADGSITHITSSVISGITTDWDWYIVEMVVPLYTVTDYTQIKLINEASQQFNLDVDAFHVDIKPANLPADVIPEWIKQDEDPLETLPLVQAYYWMIADGVSKAIALSTALNTTSARMVLQYPNEMVRTPELDISAITHLQIRGVSNINTTNVTISALPTTNKIAEFVLTVVSGLVAGQSGHVRLSASGTPYLALDARY